MPKYYAVMRNTYELGEITGPKDDRQTKFDHCNILATVNAETAGYLLFNSLSDAKKYAGYTERTKPVETGLGRAIFGFFHPVAAFITTLVEEAINTDVIFSTKLILQLYIHDRHRIIPTERIATEAPGEPHPQGCIGGLSPLRLRPTLTDQNRRAHSPIAQNNNIIVLGAQALDGHYKLKTGPSAPNTYVALAKNKTEIQFVRDLLKDYCRTPLRLFFSLHWNRHHRREAMQLIQTLNDPSTTIEKTFQLLWQARTDAIRAGANAEGSFLRRLEFAILKLRPAIENKDLSPEPNPAIRNNMAS